MLKNTNISLLFIGFMLLIWSGAGAASDIEKEHRWAQQFVDNLVVGEALQLKANGTEFTGIFTEASAGPAGLAVILAHGMGVHPDWPEVINPLRSELPEHGWSTLSIQMPVLDLYGGQDLAIVLDSVKARARAARKAGNTDYQQSRIEAADHFSTGMEDTLNRRVYDWLNSRYVGNKSRDPL